MPEFAHRVALSRDNLSIEKPKCQNAADSVEQYDKNTSFTSNRTVSLKDITNPFQGAQLAKNLRKNNFGVHPGPTMCTSLVPPLGSYTNSRFTLNAKNSTTFNYI